jgi:uncharacterized protein YwqG
VSDSFEQAFGWGGHRLWGRPHFPADDPRLISRYASFTTCLLHLCGDEAAGLSWGERGACHFLIEPERLAERDFSRVLYHWDAR